jgi:hypothetical protein
VLEKADNVLPCYAIIQRQLGAEVTEDPRAGSDIQNFAHSSIWSWNGKELAMHGEGRSKRAAKNEAARQVLIQLINQESELMDPSRNAMVAEWAIQWMNLRLEASMEVQEETAEELPEQDGFEVERQHGSSHMCSWSCQYVPTEITARSQAGTGAESRRQLMAALYNELPDSLDGVIQGLSSKTPTLTQAAKDPAEASLSKTNVMHNEVTQQLAIKTDYQHSRSPAGEMQCTLKWFLYDEVQMAQKIEEVTAVGRNKQVAKGKANQMMLVRQGHLPDLDDAFQSEILEVKNLLEANQIQEAIPRAKALIERSADNPSTWVLFLPEVLRSVLAENDFGGLSDILGAAREHLSDRGIPIDLWEALLDEASFSMRHFHLAHSALQQLASFPLDAAAFSRDEDKEYFLKFRHLLALERHGGLLHGIQQYELDPHMFCTVPLVDVHTMQADKVVLTSIPEAGVQDIAEGVRPLRSSDIVLLVPLEAVGDIRSPVGFEDEFQRASNWQHPGAWIASVTSLKGDSRMGEEVKLHTRRISRFASDANGAFEAEASSDLIAPIAPGRQYRLFHIAMETPTARMLSALRCLCQVKLPAWSENFEGRRPSYQFSEVVRKIVLGNPDEARTIAPEAARSARGVASTEQILENLTGPHSRFGTLSPTQRQAVQRAMDEQLTLIQGPPGTGKTHVACAVIAAWVQRYVPLGERILAVADSNVAADNMYVRLEAFGINCVRVGQGKEVGTTSGEQLWQAVKTAQVVVATCIGSGMEMLEAKGAARHFQRVVIDECTQACETAALVALGKSAEQVVLIGDHNQLPATVLSKAARAEGLGVSLFERMVMTNGLQPTLLIEQRRMHSSIAEFPNITFYHGQLQNAIDDASLLPVPGFPWPNPDCRVAFVDVSGVEQKRGFSAYNSAEAEAVATALEKMLQAGVPAQDLCVLTAYLAQRDEIRRAIGDRQLWHAQANLSIDTIDGYQGMERDIVLFSAARSNAERTLGFLSDARRMNVMLTRARRGVIVFGNADMLRNSHDTGSHWRAWLEWAESKGAIVPAADVITGQTGAAPHAESVQPAAVEHFSMPSDSAAAQPHGFSAPFQPAIETPGFESSIQTGFPASGQVSDLPAQHASTSSLGNSPAGAAPPPPPPPVQRSEWEKVYSEEYGRHYFWNTTTNQTTWDAPPGL